MCPKSWEPDTIRTSYAFVQPFVSLYKNAAEASPNKNSAKKALREFLLQAKTKVQKIKRLQLQKYKTFSWDYCLSRFFNGL